MSLSSFFISLVIPGLLLKKESERAFTLHQTCSLWKKNLKLKELKRSLLTADGSKQQQSHRAGLQRSAGRLALSVPTFGAAFTRASVVNEDRPTLLRIKYVLLRIT